MGSVPAKVLCRLPRCLTITTTARASATTAAGQLPLNESPATPKTSEAVVIGRLSAAKLLDNISAALRAGTEVKDAEDRMAAAAFAAGRLDIALTKLEALLQKAGLQDQLPELRDVIALAQDQKKMVMLTGSDEVRIEFNLAAGRFYELAETVRENI